MTSTFAWLDFDEPARRRMREIVALLSEPGSLDELGLGRIRDAFSDRLFPGTSVLWRRARYLLFVSWIYQQLERDGIGNQSGESAARRLQKKLRNRLLESGDTDGLIGMRAQDPVQPPDGILWAALDQWGLRDAGAGSLAQHRAGLPSRGARSFEPGEAPVSVWSVRLPRAPRAFPDDASFALRKREAEFLRDQLQADDAPRESIAGRRADSMLADMLRVDELLDVSAPWDHNLSENASDELSLALHLSGCFSDVMQGARLLYARRLGELRHDDRYEEADAALRDWADEISGARAKQLDQWGKSLDEFFFVVGELIDVRPGERVFVEEWSKLALGDPAAISRSAAALHLVEERERVAKGGRARLIAPRDQDHGVGGAIPAPLTYRWDNARKIAQDIRLGLESGS